MLNLKYFTWQTVHTQMREPRAVQELSTGALSSESTIFTNAIVDMLSTVKITFSQISNVYTKLGFD